MNVNCSEDDCHNKQTKKKIFQQFSWSSVAQAQPGTVNVSRMFVLRSSWLEKAMDLSDCDPFASQAAVQRCVV